MKNKLPVKPYRKGKPVGKFSAELREILTSRNISLEEAAQKLDVSVRSVYRWVTGDVVPPRLTVWAIRQRLTTD